MEEITLWKGLLNLILWVLIYYVLGPVLRPPYRLKRSSRFIGYILILFFCLYPFWSGDYYHYRDSFEFIKSGGYNHYEEVYLWIITHWGYSYTFFRLIVWGSALVILFCAYKRVCENYDMTLFFFGVLFMVRFSYARASLAMALILLGMTFLFNPIKKKQLLSLFIGIAITCSAFFFHRSSAIVIVVAFSTFLLINNSKNKIIIIAITIPFSSFIVSYLLNGIMDMDFDAYDAALEGKIDSYLTNEVAERGIAVKLLNFLMCSSMILTALAYVIVVAKGDDNKFSRIEKAIASYVFVIMMISMGLMLDVTHQTQVVSLRIMYFAMPASAVLMTSLKSHNCVPRLFKYTYYLGLAAACFSLMYSTYMGYNRM